MSVDTFFVEYAKKNQNVCFFSVDMVKSQQKAITKVITPFSTHFCKFIILMITHKYVFLKFSE